MLQIGSVVPDFALVEKTALLVKAVWVLEATGLS